MSPEQKAFLKKQKTETITILIIQIMIVVVTLVLWEYLSIKGFINTFIYSSPSKIISTMFDVFKSGDLFKHIFCTLKEVVISFGLGSLLGIFIATILYEYKMLAKIIEPFLIMLNSLPKVALGPLIIIIFGANIKSVIIMALLINLIVTIMSLYNGFSNTDNNKLLLIKSFKATRIQTLKYLVFPEAFKTILSALKINVSMTLIGVIMGEFLVSKEGIGYLIIYGSQIFNMSLVMTGILLLVILSIVIYKIVSTIEKILIK